MFSRKPFFSKKRSAQAHTAPGGHQREKKDESEHIIWNFDTICRDRAGIGNGIFYEKGDEPEASEASSGICVGSDDRGVRMVPAHSGYRYVGGVGSDCLDPGGGRIPAGDGLPAHS